MKVTYPIVIHDDGEVMENGEKYLLVTVPDLDLMTQGTDVDDALEMAYDIIGLTCAYWEKDGHKETMPEPSSIHNIKTESPEDIVTLVHVDLDQYRRETDGRAVRKSVSIPAWMSYAAEKAGLSLSAVLQEGLKRELNLA